MRRKCQRTAHTANSSRFFLLYLIRLLRSLFVFSHSAGFSLMRFTRRDGVDDRPTGPFPPRSKPNTRESLLVFDENARALSYQMSQQRTPVFIARVCPVNVVRRGRTFPSSFKLQVDALMRMCDICYTIPRFPVIMFPSHKFNFDETIKSFLLRF